MPPALPTFAGDLDAWSVYADALLERDDPRGELIARELAVPADATERQRIALANAVHPFCPLHRSSVWTRWSLAHVEELGIELTGRGLLQASSIFAAVETQTLRVLNLSLRAGVPTPMWTALFARVPVACTRVRLSIDHRGIELADLARLLEWIPDHVRELTLNSFVPGALGLVVTDRFDRVEISGWVDDPRAYPEACSALERTARVRVRTWTEPRGIIPHPRLELGESCDGIVELTDRRVALRRWGAEEIATFHGYLPIRVRLAHTYLEPHHLRETRVLRSRDIKEGVFLRSGERWALGRADGTTTELTTGSSGELFGEPFVFSIAS